MPRYRPRPTLKIFSNFIPEPPNGVDVSDYLDNIVSLLLTPKKKEPKKTRTTKYPIANFEAIRTYAHSLNLKNVKEWQVFAKSGKLALNCPTNPNRTYKDQWIDWYDWLGKSR